jgi:hypothetical protein
MTSTFTTTNAANLNTVLHGLRRDHALHASGRSFPDRFRPKWRGEKGSRRPHLVAIMTTIKLPN